MKLQVRINGGSSLIRIALLQMTNALRSHTSQAIEEIWTDLSLDPQSIALPAPIYILPVIPPPLDPHRSSLEEF